MNEKNGKKVIFKGKIEFEKKNEFELIHALMYFSFE